MKLLLIHDDRIGHLACYTELFLRQKKKGRYVGIASTTPANKQLFKMFKRKIRIIQLPRFLWKLCELTIFNWRLKKLGIFEANYENMLNHSEFNKLEPVIKFNEEEEKKGKELLRKMGLKENNRFVCILARDSAYLNKLKKGSDNPHSYRNWNIEDANAALNYITSKGYYILRMGAAVEKEFKHDNPMIIDYASEFRTDFGDIYLSAKCRFFFSDGCGLSQASQIFNVKQVWVNLTHLNAIPLTDNDLYIGKKFFSIKKNRLLTNSEITSLDLDSLNYTEDYKNAGIQLIDNTPEEILELVKEEIKK